MFMNETTTKILKFLTLAPLSLLYGLGVRFWLWLYEIGFRKRSSFGLPVISVGNLSTGGAGKTPHVEYLAHWLSQYLEVATLSRGYGRKTTGFRLAEPNDSPETVGDEPLMLKRKLPELAVAVSEDRLQGIPKLLAQYPDRKCILLDDAFQHLPIRAGLNILLTEYSHPFFEDQLLPWGNLREPRKGMERGDIIIVTKCPEHLSKEQGQAFKEKLQPLAHQKIFFTSLEYGLPYYFFDGRYRFPLGTDTDIVLMSGIAKPKYLKDFVSQNSKTVTSFAFADHHDFEKGEMAQVARTFEELKSDKKIILTTEKDATRLASHWAFIQEKKLPLYVVPIRVSFLWDSESEFQAVLKEWMLSFKS